MRANQAPRAGTVLLAALLTIFAAVVFFTTLLPSAIAGIAMGTLALWAAIIAFVIVLLGSFIRGL
ncbi:MAG TPA: hypothetical protein VH723_00845 [Candidatus Limnocylindrales bacterium]|jgi:hypothetical protein